MKSKKIKRLIAISLLLVSIVCIIISVIEIIKWNSENKKTEKIVNQIEEIVEIEEVIETEETEIEVIEQKVEVPKENPYWDYIKMNLINVNFDELKKKNDSTVGWIQVKGTNINYPFVQTTDNDYYLTHSFNKSKNSAGWVFLDYRNNLTELDKNTILYAHGRLDNTMFGTLKNILKSNWIKNTDNYVIKLSTEYENTLWQVFSIYRIPTTNDYIQVEFNDNQEFLNLANTLLNRSAHNFNTTINETDHILTLSTCYNDTDKVVLHAKLIKKEKR